MTNIVLQGAWAPRRGQLIVWGLEQRQGEAGEQPTDGKALVAAFAERATYAGWSGEATVAKTPGKGGVRAPTLAFDADEVLEVLDDLWSGAAEPALSGDLSVLSEWAHHVRRVVGEGEHEGDASAAGLAARWSEAVGVLSPSAVGARSDSNGALRKALKRWVAALWERDRAISAKQAQAAVQKELAGFWASLVPSEPPAQLSVPAEDSAAEPPTEAPQPASAADPEPDPPEEEWRLCVWLRRPFESSVGNDESREDAFRLEFFLQDMAGTRVAAWDFVEDADEKAKHSAMGEALRQLHLVLERDAPVWTRGPLPWQLVLTSQEAWEFLTKIERYEGAGLVVLGPE